MTAKILLVDDAGLAVAMHRRALKEFGPECFIARNGEEGLAMYREHKPDIVICDLLMPKMDGYQFLEQLKTIDPDHCTIIVTSDMQNETKGHVLKLGAKAILNKPYRPEQLAELVRNLLPHTVED
jgi:two-component system, OmpR family, response regulator SaeR